MVLDLEEEQFGLDPSIEGFDLLLSLLVLMIISSNSPYL